MKIKTVLVAGLAGGIGYVLGTKAGTSRYEEIKAKADQLAKSPQVQETVANLAEGVKKNAAKLPDPVAEVVTSVADRATGSSSGSSSATSSSTSGTTGPDLDLSETADIGEPVGLGETTLDGPTTLGDPITPVDEPTDPFVEPVRPADPYDSTDTPPRNL